MKRFYRLTALVLCLLLLCGCTQVPADPTDNPGETTATGGQASTDPQPTKPGDTEPTKPAPTGNGGVAAPDGGYDADEVIDIDSELLPYSQDEIFQQLFDRSNRIDIDIQMADEELMKLQKDFEENNKSPIYRMGDLYITITTSTDTTTYRVGEVGVRMKGNTSRCNFYSEEEGIYNYIHFKLDFQETFDDEEQYGSDAKGWESKDVRKARKNRTFATLEKLELRWNKCADATYLKEGYAYDLYRSEGVMAPHTNLASLDWSGLHMGVYTINEPVDEVFLSKNLPQEDLGGDLYKLGWTHEGATFTKTDSIGIEDEMKREFYIYDLKTNKKTSQHEQLKNLILSLNAPGVTKESYAELVDVDSFLNFAAVSYFLGNPDDLRHNYNNCYLYFLKSSGKAVIIPYDYDRCLGVTYEYNPAGDAVTTDNPFGDRTAATHYEREQENPLYIYSVDKGGYYVREFADVLARVASNIMLQPESFQAKFDQAKAIYGNDVNPDKDLKNDNGRDLGFYLEGRDGNLSFADYITKKMATYRSYLSKVEEYAVIDLPVISNYYVRGDFNDWSVREGYEMVEEDGQWVYYANFNHNFSIKVYDKLNDEWYGTDFFDENTTVEYTTNEHDNIELRPGKYRIAFDPETLIVTVTTE